MPRKTGGGGIFLVAVILSLACAYGFYLFMDRLQQGQKKNWDPVVVAIADIPAKVKITEEMIEVKPRPKDLIAPDACISKDQVLGKYLRDRVRSIEQIRTSDLFELGDPSAPHDLKIPEGMRAVSIGADEIKAVGASVKPGNFVDITATYTDPVSKRQITHMILQRAEVLWVNKGQANKNQEGGAESSMTLLVKPDEVELLTAAERAGVIRVSLRSTHDTQVFPRPLPPGLLFEPVEPTPVVVLTNDTPRATPVFISSPSPMRQGTKVYKGDKIIDVETDR